MQQASGACPRQQGPRASSVGCAPDKAITVHRNTLMPAGRALMRRTRSYHAESVQARLAVRHGRARQLRGLLLHPGEHAGRVVVPRDERALARAHVPARGTRVLGTSTAAHARACRAAAACRRAPAPAGAWPPRGALETLPCKHDRDRLPRRDASLAKAYAECRGPVSPAEGACRWGAPDFVRRVGLAQRERRRPQPRLGHLDDVLAARLVQEARVQHHPGAAPHG